MNSSLASKFLFDTTQDFDGTLDDLPSITPRDHKRMADESYQKGYGDAQGAIEKYAMEVLNACHESILRMIEEEKNVINTFHKEVSELCQVITQKVLPKHFDEAALPEIQGFLEESLKGLPNDRSFKLYCHPNLVEKMNTFLQGFPHEGAREVVPDSSLSMLDCRIEWEGGGIQRYMTTVLEKIDYSLSRLSQKTTEKTKGSEISEPEVQPETTSLEETP